MGPASWQRSEERCYAVGSGFEHMRKMMNEWDGGQLISWRWGSLIGVLRPLIRREQALRSAWSLERFGDPTVGAAADKAICSRIFWVYAKFLVILSGALELKSQWCEGCLCHDDADLSGSYWTRRRRLAGRLMAATSEVFSFGKGVLPNCPFRGRRAAEFAQGEFLRIAELMIDISREKLQTILTGELTDDERTTLVGDWQSATDVILTELNLKTSFWMCLPWRLAGLGCRDLEAARRCGCECIKLWKESPGQGASSSALGRHHLMTRRFLDPVPWQHSFGDSC